MGRPMAGEDIYEGEDLTAVGGREVEEDRDERYGFEMEPNRRLVGEQDLALGFKFNAKGTIDCYEGELELLPESRARRREIAFNMVDGDFKVFEGNMKVDDTTDEGGEVSAGQEFPTTLLMWWGWSLSSGFQLGYSKEGFAKRSKPTLFVSRVKAERIQRLHGLSDNRR